MIFSHRGNGTHHPPNTIPAFEEALQAGADGFECDLRLTGDGQVVVLHDGSLRAKRAKISIARSTLARLNEVSEHKLLTLDELLDYIAAVRAPAFLELKDFSPILSRRVAEGLDRRDIWDLAHVVGFPVLVWHALRAQLTHPKLHVHRIQFLPATSLFAAPRTGSGALMGWLDSIPGSERLFRAALPPRRLAALRRRYEQRGMRVVGGVVNRDDGFDHFLAAGIRDVVTDDVPAAVAFYGRVASHES